MLHIKIRVKSNSISSSIAKLNLDGYAYGGTSTWADVKTQRVRKFSYGVRQTWNGPLKPRRTRYSIDRDDGDST